jgi:hypothetical protein
MFEGLETLGWKPFNIPATGYVAGQKYTITATGTHNGAS